jgi:hypothetical protein
MTYKTTLAFLSMPSPILAGKSVAEALISGESLEQQATWLNDFTLSNLRKENGDNYPTTDMVVMQEIIKVISPYLSDQRLFDLNESLCLTEVKREQQAFRNSTFARFFMYEEMEREIEQKTTDRFIYHYQNTIKPEVQINFNNKRANELTFLQFHFLSNVNLSNPDTIVDAEKPEKPILDNKAEPIESLTKLLDKKPLLTKRTMEDRSPRSHRSSIDPKRASSKKKNIFTSFFQSHTTITEIGTPINPHKIPLSTPQHNFVINEIKNDLLPQLAAQQKTLDLLNNEIKELEGSISSLEKNEAEQEIIDKAKNVLAVRLNELKRAETLYAQIYDNLKRLEQKIEEHTGTLEDVDSRTPIKK